MPSDVTITARINYNGGTTAVLSDLTTELIPLVVELNGVAITTYTVAPSAYGSEPAGSFLTPDAAGVTTGVLVGPGSAYAIGAGNYQVWVRYAGDPETVVMPATGWFQVTGAAGTALPSGGGGGGGGAVDSVNGRTGAVTLTKADVGLSSVDDTSDAGKPLSTADVAALAAKAPTARQILAGTGLTGGGDLSGDRTLTVTYGTTSATATQGNDSRVTGAAQKSANLSDLASAPTARTNLGLATVAATGAYADLTGTVPTAALPPLAISETAIVASQAAMLALAAQRGDVAVRTDTGKTYILASDSPGTLADWKEILAAGQVQSVAGKTGVVSLVKGDVGLGNVDNTSDADKAVSTATQTALDAKVPTSRTITAGSGLTGGGDLTTDRTVAASYGTPGASAVGDSAAAGSAATVAHSDHVHGREAFGSVVANTTYGASSATGTATTLAHSDHNHGLPAIAAGDVPSLDAAKITTGTLAAARLPDATGSTKGVVELAGDLGGTAAVPTVPGLTSKAPTSRTITAGTGLTGGGDLSADRTLTVSYGTASGTAAQGNDSRITGAAQTASNLSDLANAATARTNLGLAAVAASGNYSDLSGTVPTAALPPLAISETTVVASQAAMLALTAQRGDVAVRSDTGKTYILSSDSPTTLADWKEILAAGQVASVAGKTGVVSLVKADVGLGSVDNTADADKPVSTAQQAALDTKAPTSRTLTAGTGLTGGGDLSADRTFAVSYGTPGSSAVADSVAAGTAGTAARSDHVHGREAFATAGSSAVGDTVSAGSATTLSHSDHRHGREAFGTPGSSAVADAAAAGAATTVARSDHTHGREAFASPVASAVGDTVAAGTATTLARSDHKHAREASATAGASAVADTAAAGSASTVALSDHRHSREAFGSVTANSGYNTASATGSATTVSHSDHNHGLPAIAESDVTNLTTDLAARPRKDVQTFTTTGAGTFNIPSWAVATSITTTEAIGSGGGGGSGRKDTASLAVKDGGGGGGGACLCKVTHKTLSFGAAGGTLNVFVGAGGAGGAARTTTQDGAAGTGGQPSYVGTSAAAAFVHAAGGNGGAGGTATTTAGGTIGTGMFNGSAGGAGGASGSTGTASANSGGSATGGGGGGGVDNANAVYAGGASGIVYSIGTTVSAGGTIGGTAPTTGITATVGDPVPGTGGGGGAGKHSAAAQNGADGGRYGGGGGGGGGSTGDSGAGGTGGNGIIVMTTWE